MTVIRCHPSPNFKDTISQSSLVIKPRRIDGTASIRGFLYPTQKVLSESKCERNSMLFNDFSVLNDEASFDCLTGIALSANPFKASGTIPLIGIGQNRMLTL